MLPIYYSSTEPNAPTLNNAAGSMLAVLDAVLVNGFGLKSVTSITVAGGVATVTCTGHQFTGGIGRKVAIAGASPSELNGSHDVTVVNANTFTYPTTAAAGTATGTITAKRPSIGWTKPYTGTNTAMYGRTDPAATAMLMRVEDTAATPTYARMIGVESATDINTYTGPFPTTTQYAGAGLWMSKGVSNTTAKRWVAVGDGRTLYLFTDDTSYSFASYGGWHMSVFGDVESWRSGGDAYGCLAGSGRDSNGSNNCHISNFPSSDQGMFLCRAGNLVGGSTRASFWIGNTSFTPGSNSPSSGPSYPSPIDNGMAISRQCIVREDQSAFNFPFRGQMRGMAWPMASLVQSSIEPLNETILGNWIGDPNSYLFIGVVGQGTPGGLLFNMTAEW